MWNRLLIVALLFASFTTKAQNEVSIIHDGHYQGKNLYVQNPFAGSGVGFCVIKVTVNGDVTTDQFASSAFEIDFSNLNLEVGDPVTVKIFHKGDCLPKVLNPEVLRPRSTFETVDIKIENNILKWTTTGEQGKLPYIIEQYRWTKWIKVGEVDGTGSAEKNSYEFSITPHSGENKFRVKQIDYTGKPRISPSAKYADPSIPQVTLLTVSPRKVLEFSSETLFEIFDTYGNLVKKGYGKVINVENLKKGLYYVNFDSSTGEVCNKK